MEANKFFNLFFKIKTKELSPNKPPLSIAKRCQGFFTVQSLKCYRVLHLENFSFIAENRIIQPEAEFKEFEPRLKFKSRLKYGWFHLKLYSIFQDLSRRSIETGFWWI